MVISPFDSTLLSSVKTHSTFVLVSWRLQEVSLFLSILSRHSDGVSLLLKKFKIDIFLLIPVRDSQWSNIWSQERIFECLCWTLFKTFKSSVKINIPSFYDSNTFVSSASEAGAKYFRQIWKCLSKEIKLPRDGMYMERQFGKILAGLKN